MNEHQTAEKQLHELQPEQMQRCEHDKLGKPVVCRLATVGAALICNPAHSDCKVVTLCQKHKDMTLRWPYGSDIW